MSCFFERVGLAVRQVFVSVILAWCMLFSSTLFVAAAAAAAAAVAAAAVAAAEHMAMNFFKQQALWS